MSNSLQNIKIAISGKSGCGNTTVSKIVAEKLKLNMINYTFRAMAEEKGLDFKELCRMAETDESYDRELDKKQVSLAMEGGCVLGSRLAIWMLEQADLKVYLTASTEVRASRINSREGGTLEQKMTETLNRDKADSVRYRRLYDIDNDDYSVADLVIDAAAYDQYQIADQIIDAAKKVIKDREQVR